LGQKRMAVQRKGRQGNELNKQYNKKKAFAAEASKEKRRPNSKDA